MKAKDLVLSIEQMLHLEELGLKVKNTAFVWYKKPYEVEYTLRKDHHKNNFQYEFIPTLTLQEILEMLPDHIVHNNLYYELLTNRNECWIGYKLCSKKEDNRTNLKIYAFMKDEIRAAYNMLCWVAENGYLNNKENENN